MKYIIVILIFVFGLNFLSAQTTGQIGMNASGAGALSGVNAQLSYLLGPISERNKKTSEQAYGIQGSAYTEDKFDQGKIYYGDEFEGTIFYRYNAYYEEIEITKVNLPGAPMNTLNRDKKIRVITKNGNPISFKTYIDKKKLTQNGYLTKIREGKYTLYRRLDIKYTQGQKSQNSFIPAIPARFTKFIEYYLEIEGFNKIQELELSKKKLLKLIPEDQKAGVKEFIKKNKVKFKNEYGLFEVLDFLNKK